MRFDRSARVEVLGGGPAGLYVARLLKLRHPDWIVRVHEKREPGATFGFGIGLAVNTLRRMADADPATYDALIEIGHRLQTWNLRIGSQSINGGDNQSIGLSRAGLLHLLADHAVAAGVEIRWGRRVHLADVADADLVVGADGVASATRSSLADEIGVTVEAGDLAYIWCGATLRLDTMQFEVVETEHGVFVAHVMPYGAERCTFQVDARLDAVHRAGFELGSAALGANDAATLDYLSAAFARILDGAALQGDRSVWSSFQTVRCHQWSVGNVVLIGDAAHTAHYSVGSGTRMAMEDALALANAIDAHAELPVALRAYESVRRPAVERLQSRALRSQAWWAAFPVRMGMPMPQLMANYQTRTGAVGATALAKADPRLFLDALLQLDAGAPPIGSDAPNAILACPLTLTRTTVPCRVVVTGQDQVLDVPADAADVAAARERDPGALLLARVTPALVSSTSFASKLIEAGADAVHLFAEDGSGDLLDRLDVAERIRLAGVPVAVQAGAADIERVSAGVLAGRVDLVTLTQGAAA